MILELPHRWQQEWHGRDPFDALMDMEGEIFKSRQGRTTLRFRREGRFYFAKLHRGVAGGCCCAICASYAGR